MGNFWTFYQNIETLAHPFRVFSFAHLAYVVLTVAVIVGLLKAYKKRDEAGKVRWQRIVAAVILIQEIFFYAWIWVGCEMDPFFEVLHLELCTFCVFLDASILFCQNKQVRFFGAVIGLLGAPIAIAYPVTVAEIYPAFSYRLIGFYLSHGALVLFALMMLSDRELLSRKRLLINTGILAAMLTFVYFFNLKFGTKYMFVGIPPEIGIIRMVYDAVGPYAFLPAAAVILCAYQALMYFVAKKIQKWVYPVDSAE